MSALRDLTKLEAEVEGSMAWAAWSIYKVQCPDNTGQGTGDRGAWPGMVRMRVAGDQ